MSNDELLWNTYTTYLRNFGKPQLRLGLDQYILILVQAQLAHMSIVANCLTGYI